LKLIKFVQRKRALGDVLWIEPVLRLLARDYRFVVVNTLYADLFKNYPLKNVYFRKNQHPLIKIVREISKALFRSAGFLDLDNVYEKSPGIHILQAYFIAAGYPNETLTYPKIYPSVMHDNIKRKKNVVIHLSASSNQKNYRTIEGVDWIRIKNYFESCNIHVIGISDELSHENYYSEIVSPTIQELITIIDNCDLFIGLDSGPSHIAASLKKKAIIFFGSVNPAYRHLMNEFTGKIIQNPCIYAGCYHEFFDSEKRKCLLVDDSVTAPCCRFTTEELLSAIESFQTL
jgi:ADP-heptose:LPS heptosyltransferase